MSAPTVMIVAQPVEAATLVYASLAAKAANDLPNGQLSIVLTIISQEPVVLHLSQVVVSFTGPPTVASSTFSTDVTFNPGEARQWWFPYDQQIILPDPAPGNVTISCAFDNFSDPASITMPLAAYPDSGYLFPARESELKKGELWAAGSAAHPGGGDGAQIFAYDLAVYGFDQNANAWRRAKEGNDGKQNDHYFTWGKPIYAMAAGTVVKFFDGMPENTPPLFPSPTPDPGEGNHFYIQHGNDLALYAHLQPGSLPPALQVIGAAVAEGDFLGLAGNTGRSSEPHLHTQINRATQPGTGPPRPLTFRDVSVLELTKVDPNGWPAGADSPWNIVSGRALPNVLSAIWPGKVHWKPYKLVYVLLWMFVVVVGGLVFVRGGMINGILGALTIAAGIAGLTRNLSPPKPSAHAVEDAGKYFDAERK